MLAILRFILLEAVPLTAQGLLPAALFELLSNKAALEATFLRLGSLRSSLLLFLPGGASLLLLLGKERLSILELVKWKAS